GMTVAGLGDPAEPAPLATGVLTRGEAEIAHELARGVETGEVAELGDRGDRHRELDPPQRLQSFDHRRETPRRGLLEQLRLEALQDVRAFGDGAHVFLEDRSL